MEETNKEEKKEEQKPLFSRVIEETEKSIETLLKDGITTTNVETLSQLVDIHKDIIGERKEINNMYGNYGNYSGNYGNYGRDSYGREQYGENYGRRGRDSRYRGDEYMGRVNEEYGRYQESRSYGSPEETDKSFHYMVKALEDFIKVLEEEAETQQQKMQLKQALQNSMR